MKQLTLQDIQNKIVWILASGGDLRNYPVYIGNDDELNGIHCAWFFNELDKNEDSDEMNMYKGMIEEDSHNIKLINKGVLIS